MPVRFPPGRAKLLNQSSRNGIRHAHEDQRHRSGDILASDCGIGCDGDKYVDLQAQQLRRQLGKALKRARLIPVLNIEVLALDVAEITQALAECFRSRGIGSRGHGGEIADACQLLHFLRRGGVRRGEHGS